MAVILITTSSVFALNNDKLIVNKANFQISEEAFSLDTVKFKDENYIKLRDFAALVNHRLKDFSVDYVNGKILLDTSKAYEQVKDDLSALKDLGAYKIGKSDIYIDGKVSQLASINIKDYNYFRLRDLCKVLAIDVDWNQDKKIISLSTKGGSQDMDQERLVSFVTTDDFAPLTYAGIVTKVLPNGDLQIVYSVRVNTGGYRLGTKEVKISNGKISISPDLRGPGPNQMVTQVISYPTTSIIINKADLPKTYTIEVVGSEPDYVDR